MKSPKFLLAAIALCVSLASFSQTDTTKKDTTTRKTDTTKRKDPSIVSENANTAMPTQQATISQPATSASTTATAASHDAAVSNITTSTPKPNFGRYYIPVLGSYTAIATSVENKSIKISADENNPGKIWIDGLAGTKFYALLKTAPGTYKIPAQKQDEHSVAEGTVMYDESNKQINICLGCGYNEEAPAVSDAVASVTPEPAKSKKDHHLNNVKKIAVVSFSGTKADQGTVSILQ